PQRGLCERAKPGRALKEVVARTAALPAAALRLNFGPEERLPPDAPVTRATVSRVPHIVCGSASVDILCRSQGPKVKRLVTWALGRRGLDAAAQRLHTRPNPY